MYCSNPPKTCPCKAYFAGWCFTHQYKNTTQFYFYAALLSSQNTKRKISDISYIKSSEDVGIERFYLTQHGAVVTMTFSFVLKKSIPQGAYENVIIGYLPSDIKPVQETWPLMGEQGSNKSHQGRVKSNGQIELWCWGADALDKDHIFSCTAVFLVNT